jgi:hypothetical protein
MTSTMLDPLIGRVTFLDNGTLVGIRRKINLVGLTFTDDEPSDTLTITGPLGPKGDPGAAGTNWGALDSSSFASAPASPTTITMLVDHSYDSTGAFVIEPGAPVRVLDMAGEPFEGASCPLSAWDTITGIDSTLLGNRGVMQYEIVDDGGGFVHVELTARGILVAHTASVNAPAVAALIEDNSSGVGGAISIDALVPIAIGGVDFYKWVLVQSCTSALMTVVGPALGGPITEMWIGDQARVQTLHFEFAGPYAIAATASLIEDIGRTFVPWIAGRARVIMASVRAESVDGAGGPTVNIAHGGGNILDPGIVIDGTKQMALPAVGKTLIDATADDFEASTTIGTASDQDLTINLTLVLE